MLRGLLGWCVLILAAALCGCGRFSLGSLAFPPRQIDGFSLHVWDDSYIGGATFQGLGLSIAERGDAVEVDVAVKGAVHLKALYFDLSYDAERFRPESAQPTGAMGPAEDLLHLSVFREAGKVYYGQIVAHPEQQRGLYGDSVLVRLSFRQEPALRYAAMGIEDPGYPSTELTWDGLGTLSWRYYNSGDYDQNGLVNLADLTPIAVHYGAESPGGAGMPFPVEDEASVVDGNGNGLIGLDDITRIGAYFGSRVVGYNVYHSLDPGDFHGQWGSVDDPALRLGSLPTVALPDTPPAGRRLFTYAVAPVGPGGYYWVRPTDGVSDGSSSNFVTVNW